KLLWNMIEGATWPERRLLAQSPRAVVAAVSWRSACWTDLRRWPSDRSGRPTRHLAAQLPTQTVDLGAARAHPAATPTPLCILPLRSGTLVPESTKIHLSSKPAPASRRPMLWAHCAAMDGTGGHVRYARPGRAGSGYRRAPPRRRCHRDPGRDKHGVDR